MTKRHYEESDSDSEGPHVGSVGADAGVKNPKMKDIQSAQSDLFLPPSLEDALNFSREFQTTSMTSVMSNNGRGPFDLKIAAQNALYLDPR